MKKKNFTFIIQNNNKNKKHIKKKDKNFYKKTKTWFKFKETGRLHSARRSQVPTSYYNSYMLATH